MNVPTVLVVDDESGIVDSLVDLLTEENYTVIFARNGKDGLRRIAEQRPDIIILDYMMPVMDGATMLRELRSNPAYQTVPVLLMTSVPRRNLPPDCQPQGYLRKPFDVDELLSELRRLLG